MHNLLCVHGYMHIAIIHGLNFEFCTISFTPSITVDCGPPTTPRNGSLENYTDTTEGSVVFYRCGPGLVPEQQMRAVCTENGWSPNPADLNCFTGMFIE